MDVAYSPTGKEFVSGSYDRTIRIFNIHSAKSREVYHTKRMQRYVHAPTLSLSLCEALTLTPLLPLLLHSLAYCAQQYLLGQVQRRCELCALGQ